MSMDMKAPVVIVGGGASGCTLALLLASYSIPCIVVERRTTPLQHPAAHVLNGRAFEIWAQYSPALAREILALCPSEEEIGNIRWCTSLLGTEFGSIDLLADLELVERVRSHSEYRIAHVGQHLLMPILWRALEAEPLVTFIKGHSLESLHDAGHEVTLSVRDTNQQRTSIGARWLIGADGANSKVRELLGIAMQGPTLANMASVFFQMKLDELHSQPRPLLSWIYNPDFCGVMIKHADDNYILMTPYLCDEQAVAKAGQDYWRKVIPLAIGNSEVPFTIHTMGKWLMTTQLASSYAKGHALLIGDAAHRFPHTGGFGLNSGVQDAHNVAWKLAAILEERAPDSLLGTYELERKPVIRLFAEQSMGNHFKLDEVTCHIGLRNRGLMQVTKLFTLAPFTWLPKSARGSLADWLMRGALKKTALLEAQTAKGKRLRALLQAQVPEQQEHFISTGLEYGYAYTQGLVEPEPSAQPLIGKGVTEYRPTTWPGARLPHVMLLSDGELRPVHQLLDKRDLTLISAKPEQWSQALQALPGCAEMAVRIIGLDNMDPSARQAAIELYEVGEDGAILVRPDHHVVWRTKGSANTDAGTLVRIVERLKATYGIGLSGHQEQRTETTRERTAASR